MIADRHKVYTMRAIVWIAAALLLAACHPPTRTRPEPQPRATERPEQTPRPKPRPSPVPRDVTRDPLTKLISKSTPEDMAKALRLAEQARNELKQGTSAKAMDLLDEAIKTAPRCIPAYVLLARAEIAEGELDRARTQLGRAAELSPEPVWRAEIIALNAAIYEENGQTEKATTEYNRALRVFPGNRTARDALARLKKEGDAARPAAPNKQGGD